MNAQTLKEIIEKHEKWLERQEGGERANLRAADLCAADLRGADLREANLCGADLRAADLCGADLRAADLCGADLYEADLREANLCGADLRAANLRAADLYGADLYEADLREANLCAADLRGADLRGANNIPYIPMACPDAGSFVGWKKASGRIVKLLIPEDARRSSATGRKCRCDRAKVLEIQKLDGSKADDESVSSDHDREFIYKIGDEVSVNDFSDDRFQECAPGIHFFINRQEAVEYNAM